MRIVVMGANSFSGGHFVDFARAQGANAMAVSRSAWNSNHLRFDINKDLDLIMEMIEVVRPDYIVNYMAQSMVGESWVTPEDWYMTNVVSMTNFYKRLSEECPYLTRFVQVTTPEVYGHTQGWVKENTPFNPTTPYAVSRAAGDMSLKNYIDEFDFPAVFTRTANVYGPRQPNYRIIPKTIMSIKKMQKLPLHGGGFSERSFVHINDASDATWRVMKDGRRGETYHISSRDIVSIQAVVRHICERMEVDFDTVVEMVGERQGKDDKYMLDSNKIRDDLGWSDSISLDAGLDACVTWYTENFNELNKQPMEYRHRP